MLELRVLFEDNHCLVVEKPAGVLIAGDRTGDVSLLDHAKDYIKGKYQKPGDVYLGLVHRLDRPVSGVTLFARTSKAASRLSEQFRNDSTEKIYNAWVLGCPVPRSGTLTDWLLKDEARNVVSVVPARTAGAQDARLDFKVVTEAAGRSLLEVRLHTGRSHQIRVQLSSRGWPIIGDTKYGAQASRHPGAIALHARSLTFEHPTLHERITVQSPLPVEWRQWFGVPG